MGEKPLTTDEALPGATPDDGSLEDLDPMAGAGAINTTRSNIKNSGAMTTAPSGGGDAVDGEPVPGLDVKLGKNPGGSISGLPPGLQPTPTKPPDPIREPATGPGQGSAIGDPTGADAGSASGDQAGAGDAGAMVQPVPGIDIIVKKRPHG